MALDGLHYDKPQSTSTYVANSIIYAEDIEDNGIITLSAAATANRDFTFDPNLYAALGAVPGISYSFSIVNASAYDLTLITTGKNRFSNSGTTKTLQSYSLLAGTTDPSVLRATLLFLDASQYVIILT